MLGTQGTSAYKNPQDFLTAKDYLSYMCGGTQGVFSRNIIQDGEMKLERFYRSGSLLEQRYGGVHDCYFSQNSVQTPRNDKDPDSGRKVNNLKRLNALFVDIDCYNKGLTQEQVLYELEMDYFDSKIPTPTFVINSGRGLYLIWKINEDKNALPTWAKTEEYLIDQCAAFGADSQSSDAARVLRVPFSINSKNGKRVEIMRFYDIKYTLYEIVKEYNIKHKKRHKSGCYPYGQATQRQRSTARWLATELNIPLPNFESYNDTFAFIKNHINTVQNVPTRPQKVINLDEYRNIRSIADGRIKDLYRLFELRKGGDCCREYALFLCRLWTLDITGDVEAAVNQMLALNATLDKPFPESYAMKVTYSAERKHTQGREHQYNGKRVSGKTYTYKTSTVIKKLKITPEERRELIYLCGFSADEKEQKKVKNRKAYLLRLETEGKEVKKDSVHARREKIAEMLINGADKDEICTTLSISARTYDRDKAAIYADGLLERVKATLQRAAEKIAATAQNATDGLKARYNAVSDFAKKAENTVSPFFKPPYYRRNGVAISDVPVQLTFWDMFDGFGSDSS